MQINTEKTKIMAFFETPALLRIRYNVPECLARINSVFGTNELNRCELGISWSDLEIKVPF